MMYLFNDDKSKAEIKVIEGHVNIGPNRYKYVDINPFPSDAIVLSVESGIQGNDGSIYWELDGSENFEQGYNFPTALHRQYPENEDGSATIVLRNYTAYSRDIYYRLTYLLRG